MQLETDDNSQIHVLLSARSFTVRKMMQHFSFKLHSHQKNSDPVVETALCEYSEIWNRSKMIEFLTCSSKLLSGCSDRDMTNMWMGNGAGRTSRQQISRVVWWSLRHLCVDLSCMFSLRMCGFCLGSLAQSNIHEQAEVFPSVQTSVQICSVSEFVFGPESQQGV